MLLQDLALQQRFPFKSSHSFKNSHCHKIKFFNDGGLKLGHFMENGSRDGLAAKNLSPLVLEICLTKT